MSDNTEYRTLPVQYLIQVLRVKGSSTLGMFCLEAAEKDSGNRSSISSARSDGAVSCAILPANAQGLQKGKGPCRDGDKVAPAGGSDPQAGLSIACHALQFKGRQQLGQGNWPGHMADCWR